MRLVWSQPSVYHGRPKSLLPLAVLCIFLGGVVSDRPGIGDVSKPVRAAAASLLLTGGLLLVVSGAALVLQKSRRPGARLSLAPPEEEQR